MTPQVEAADEMRRLSKLLDDALDYLKRMVREYATCEEVYRQAKARAWVQFPDGTAREREANVDAATASERRQRDIAEGMKQAALEAVRSRRAQISAWQTLLNADKEEAAFGRTGPQLQGAA